MRGLVGLGTALLLTLNGCVFGSSEEPPTFEELQYSEVSLPPEQARLEPRSITLSVGTIVKARVDAHDSNESVISEVEYRSKDPRVMTIEPAGEEGVYILIGSGVGTTELELYLAERRIAALPVSVIEQGSQ